MERDHTVPKTLHFVLVGRCVAQRHEARWIMASIYLADSVLSRDKAFWLCSTYGNSGRKANNHQSFPSSTWLQRKSIKRSTLLQGYFYHDNVKAQCAAIHKAKRSCLFRNTVSKVLWFLLGIVTLCRFDVLRPKCVSCRTAIRHSQSQFVDLFFCNIDAWF